VRNVDINGAVASNQTVIKPVIDTGAHKPVLRTVFFAAGSAAKAAGEVLAIGAQGYAESFSLTGLGPVISAITASAGTAFLGDVHIRPGRRPKAGNWTITFPTATTCVITPPGGSAGAAKTVAAATAYDGTITGAEDFYIKTGAALTIADEAVITVSYTAGVSIIPTLASPGNAFSAVAAIPGLAGKLARKGLYTVVTTATTVTVGFNGSAQSAAKTIAAGGVYFDIIPGFVFTAEADAVTAETNYYLVDVAEPVEVAGVLAEPVDPSASSVDAPASMLWHGAVIGDLVTVGGVAATPVDLETLESSGRIFAV
jgi:hypothetical protein